MARIPPALTPQAGVKFSGHRTTLVSAHHFPEDITGEEGLAAKLARQSQYMPPRVQAIVLDYSNTLKRLYKSLTEDSSQPGLLEQKIHEARIAMVLARASLLNLQVEQKRTHHLAMHDDLTALPNRRFLVERLERALANAHPPWQALALLHMEFNSRQTLGDHGSYHCNDALLKIVAARLERSVRAEDIVCRFGGDEFACLVPGVSSRAQATHLVSTLFGAVSAPLQIGSLEISLQLNIGIALFPADGVTVGALLKNAQASMRTAKQQRSGYAFFDRGRSTQRNGFPESAQRDRIIKQ